jgi:hypothetical protein
MTLFRIEAIKPKDTNAAKIFKEAYETALRATAKEVQRDLEATTATWETHVKFTVRVTSRRGELGITVSTKNEIYKYVNYGTKPHVIRPKKGKVLAFQSGYKAKTRPSVIGSKPGGSFGATVIAKEVHHPGSEARLFDVAIARRRQVSLKSRMDAAFVKAARKANS